jgi:hypothetical protein
MRARPGSVHSPRSTCVWVIETGLVMLDKNDIRFKVDNFDRAAMADLEKRWDEIGAALRLGASLLADFGFSAATLTANSVLIPMADYLNRRGVAENYRTSSAHREDRAALRRWAQRSLMKAGAWGSGLDTLLTGLRSVIRQYGAEGWPSDALDREMARQGKQLRFDATEIDDLLELEYGAKRLFPMLAMLYPIDTRNQFHQDHLFPRSILVSRKKYSWSPRAPTRCDENRPVAGLRHWAMVVMLTVASVGLDADAARCP